MPVAPALTIRNQQFAALANAHAREFEYRLEHHLRSCFPAECESLGKEGLRAALRAGLVKAKAYHLDTERQIAQYLNVQFALGLRFDEVLEWAAAILRDEESPAGLRIDRLCERALRAADERRAND